MATEGTVLLFAPALIIDADGPHRGTGVVTQAGRVIDRGPLGELAGRYRTAVRVDLDEHALLPGTVNSHSHSFQSLLRGLGDDLSFDHWRDVLYRHAPRLDEEAVHVAALHAFAEMLRNGITTVIDFFYLHHDGNAHALAVVDAAHATGIRLVVARAGLDLDEAPRAFIETPTLAAANLRELAARLQGDRFTSVIPASHSPHGASVEMIRSSAELAREWGTPWHIHVAENQHDGVVAARHGTTPIAWLAREGLLDQRTRIVHGVWVDAHEVEALAHAGAGLVHCPASNLFLGDGICPLDLYIAAGIPTALGCDSGSANSQLSVFGEMRLAALLQKARQRRGDAIDAATTFRMGTANGGFASGLPVGTLDIGSYADLVALNTSDLSLAPLENLERSLIYSVERSAIRHVWVGGKLVVRDGALTRVDATAIAERVRTTCERLNLRRDITGAPCDA